MRGLIAAEWLKIRKRRLPWILAACVVGIIGLLYTVLLVALSSASTDSSLGQELDASLRLRNVVTFGDGIIYRSVALLSLVLAAVVAANEYHWRTVVLRTAWTGERLRPMGASLVLVATLSVGGLVLGYLTTIVSFLVIGAFRGTLAAGDLGPWLLIDSGLGIARTAPPVLLFVIAATAIASLTKSSAAGIALPLAVLLLEPLGTAILSSVSALDPVKPLLLSRNVDALLAANGAVAGAEDELPAGLSSAWLAGGLLLAYAAALGALTARVVARREVTD